MRGVYNWCKTGSYMAPFYHGSLELSHCNDPLTGSVLSLPFPQNYFLIFLAFTLLMYFDCCPFNIHTIPGTMPLQLPLIIPSFAM